MKRHGENLLHICFPGLRFKKTLKAFLGCSTVSFQRLRRLETKIQDKIENEVKNI